MCEIFDQEREEGRFEGREEGRLEGIAILVITLEKLQVSTDKILEAIVEGFHIPMSEAQKYIT